MTKSKTIEQQTNNNLPPQEAVVIAGESNGRKFIMHPVTITTFTIASVALAAMATFGALALSGHLPNIAQLKDLASYLTTHVDQRILLSGINASGTLALGVGALAITGMALRSSRVVEGNLERPIGCEPSGRRFIKHPATVTTFVIATVALASITAFGVLTLTGHLPNISQLKDLASFLISHLSHDTLISATTAGGTLTLGAGLLAITGIAMRAARKGERVLEQQREEKALESKSRRFFKHPATITTFVISTLALGAIATFGVLMLTGNVPNISHLKDLAQYLTTHLGYKMLTLAATAAGTLAVSAGALAITGMALHSSRVEAKVEKHAEPKSRKFYSHPATITTFVISTLALGAIATFGTLILTGNVPNIALLKDMASYVTTHLNHNVLIGATAAAGTLALGAAISAIVGIVFRQTKVAIPKPKLTYKEESKHLKRLEEETKNKRRVIKHPATITTLLITSVAFAAIAALGILVLTNNVPNFIHLKEVAHFLTTQVNHTVLLATTAASGALSLAMAITAIVGIASRFSKINIPALAQLRNFADQGIDLNSFEDLELIQAQLEPGQYFYCKTLKDPEEHQYVLCYEKDRYNTSRGTVAEGYLFLENAQEEHQPMVFRPHPTIEGWLGAN